VKACPVPPLLLSHVFPKLKLKFVAWLAIVLVVMIMAAFVKRFVETALTFPAQHGKELTSMYDGLSSILAPHIPDDKNGIIWHAPAASKKRVASPKATKVKAAATVSAPQLEEESGPEAVSKPRKKPKAVKLETRTAVDDVQPMPSESPSKFVVASDSIASRLRSRK
jgi:hypothetical protein